MNHADTGERLLTARDVAERLQFHQNRVYAMAVSGELPSLKINGSRRFRASELEAWLEEHRR